MKKLQIVTIKTTIDELTDCFIACSGTPGGSDLDSALRPKIRKIFKKVISTLKEKK